MFKDKNILVTGASGFIGRQICEAIKKAEGNVMELTSKNDLRDKTSLDSFHGKVDYVVHAAGKVFVPDSWNDPVSFLEVNVGGAQTIFDFCRKNKIGCTYISGYVYGKDTPLPIAEDSKINPSNPYAYSKYLGESVGKMYNSLFGVPVQIIRPFNVYGIGQSESFLIPMLIKQFKESNKVKVKDLNPKRDFIYLDDLISMILLSCFRNDFNIFNCGSGQSTSVGELIELLKEISGKNLPVENENTIRNNEIDDSIANISNAQKVLGWNPEVKLRVGLELLLRTN